LCGHQGHHVLAPYVETAAGRRGEPTLFTTAALESSSQAQPRPASWP
jgi:hypothetical protein